MTAPRIAARRFAVLLFLPACHTWQPVPLSPASDFGPDATLRVDLADRRGSSAASSSDGASTVGHRRVVFHRPQIVGDSLQGWQDTQMHSTVAIADVRHPEKRQFSAGRTTALAVTGVAVVALAVAIYQGLSDMTVPIDLGGVYSVRRY